MRPIELGALGVALVLTVLIAVVFSRTITGPINALVKRTEEIGRGGRAAIVAPEQQGTREIATLSQSFLDLAERLVDRTEYVSSFAAHVSHELKSPVTAIRGSAELMRDAEMSREEQARFLNHIIADSDRLTALLERLRELARADLDVATGTTTIAEAVRGEAMVTLGGGADVPMALGLEAAKAIFGQLLRNAARARRQGRGDRRGPRRRACCGSPSRRRRGDFAGQPRPHLRAVLHDAARSRRDGDGAADRPLDAGGAWRDDPATAIGRWSGVRNPGAGGAQFRAVPKLGRFKLTIWLNFPIPPSFERDFTRFQCALRFPFSPP